MQFQIKRDTLLKSLTVAHNIIERKNTIQILANVLLQIKISNFNLVTTKTLHNYHDVKSNKI